MKQSVIFAAIAAERSRQERLKEAGKFPFTCADEAPSDDHNLRVLVEEVGEVARACDPANEDDLRSELIQVAAVAVAWLERL